MLEEPLDCSVVSEALGLWLPAGFMTPKRSEEFGKL